MLLKVVTTPETYTQPDNLKTNSSFRAGSLGHYGTFNRIKLKQIFSFNWRSVRKWYEAVPMRNQEASEVAKAFVNIRVSKSCYPANLSSDKGSNFMSILFKNMCKELGIERTSTTAYPQGNAIIECTNHTIEESLAKNVFEHQNTLSDYLPLVMIAYRSSIHSISNYSPFYFLFGRSCALPVGCMYQTVQTKTYPTLSDYIGCLKDKLQTCHELVRESMDVEQKRRKPTMNVAYLDQNMKLVI